jgi:hypothetical protein
MQESRRRPDQQGLDFVTETECDGMNISPAGMSRRSHVVCSEEEDQNGGGIGRVAVGTDGLLPNAARTE